jgi:CheY-like chemotaxis protein
VRGGLGIGLSLVHGIVSLHGGRVEAHSSGAGKGAEFTVRLPLSTSRDSDREPKKPRDTNVLPSPGLRILVADDNKDAADSLERVLSLYGYDVRVTYDGRSALELGESFNPEIAILDIGMPGASGYDVASAMRERRGNGVTLVALTGWGQEADRRRATDAGFDYHLTKPVAPSLLNDLLVEVALRAGSTSGQT